MRAIAEGLGSELLVGTTKNALLRGDLAQGFSPVIQVREPKARERSREGSWGRAVVTNIVLLQGHTDELWGLCTHPSQNRFLTCGHDRQLCLWDGEGHALAWSMDLKVESAALDPPCHTCSYSLTLPFLLHLEQPVMLWLSAIPTEILYRLVKVMPCATWALLLPQTSS